MALQKKFIIFGIIGCFCFGIGDWFLGYVDPALIERDVLALFQETNVRCVLWRCLHS